MSETMKDRTATAAIAAWFGYFAGTHDALHATLYAAIVGALYATLGVWIARRVTSTGASDHA